MKLTGTFRFCAAFAIVLSISAAQAVSDTPAGPKDHTEVTVPDTTLRKAVLGALDSAAESGQYEKLRGLVRRAVVERMACGGVEDLTALNDMVYVLRACEYLPLTKSAPTDDPGTGAGNLKLDTWLVKHRDVSRLLFRALGDVNNVTECIGKFRKLLAAEQKTILAYPNLAVAFATARPMNFRLKDRTKTATLLESFRWYTNSKVNFRYDLCKIPYELSRHLADSRLSIAERRWVVGKYGKMTDPATSYFHLKYDTGHYKQGKDKKIKSLKLSLPNLLKVGGVCIEQAYYSAQVCKTLGIPAAIVSGDGASGIGHAWLAALKITAGGKRAHWDSTTGRYRAHRYYTGLVNSPTGGTMLDSELELTGAAAQLPLKRREHADAAVILARIADSALGRDVTEGPSAIIELTAPVRAKKSSGRPKPSRKIDMKLVEDLLLESVKLNLAHKPTWNYIIELRRSGVLPVDHLDRFFDVLVTQTAEKYLDYSCRMVMEIAPTIEDADKREKVYQRARKVYRRRPDLQGKILIALADIYAEQDKPARALKTYEQAAIRSANFGPVMLQAAKNAENLLLNNDRADRAIKMYKELWTRTTPSKSDFRKFTAHYKIGKRLSDLLAAEGYTKSAQEVLNAIGD